MLEMNRLYRIGTVTQHNFITRPSELTGTDDLKCKSIFTAIIPKEIDFAAHVSQRVLSTVMKLSP
jgi:hypothetical protein